MLIVCLLTLDMLKPLLEDSAERFVETLFVDVAGFQVGNRASKRTTKEDDGYEGHKKRSKLSHFPGEEENGVKVKGCRKKGKKVHSP